MVKVTPLLVCYYLTVFFDRILDFIFLAYQPYHMIDPSTVQRPLSGFGVSLVIKGPVQSQFQFLENRVQSLPGEIPYIES